ncbi:MAG: transglycosylase SLT domain-containing protein [Deltaproteobacteria bacterium]|nr:transglycosylase SLT domain-containing protein [Deltaproteobacteria bacterium]
MPRFLILLICLALTSCATQTVRIEIETEKVNLDTLPSSKLRAEIDKRTRQYLAIEAPQSLEKKNTALILGYLHYQAKDFSKAITYFTPLVDTQDYPLKEYVYFYLGRMALEKKKCILASSYQKNLEDHFPETSVLQRLTELLNKECRPAPAPLPRSKKERRERVKQDLFEEALQAFEDKEYKQSIVQFKKYLTKTFREDAKAEEALQKLSIMYKRLGNDEEHLKALWGLAKLKKADPKLFPYDPKWLYEVAKRYWNQEEILIAKKYLLKLIAWPKHRYVGQCYYILAKISAEQKNYPKVLEYLTKSQESPLDPLLIEEISFLKGWYARKTQNCAKAIEEFESFKDRFPKSDFFMPASYWLARCHQAIGEKETAQEFYEEIIEKNPYSYYAIRSQGRLQKTVSPLKFSQDQKFVYKTNALQTVNPKYFSKGESLIHLGLGMDGAYELKQAASFKTLFNTSWKFQYYMASLYNLGGDHISAFIILNELQNSYLEDLPLEHLLILYPKRYWSLIKEYSKRFGVDPYLVLSVMRQESAFDPKAISPADAYGLLQITPAMAQQMGKRLNIPLK